MAKVHKVINPRSGKEEEWTEERIAAYQRIYGPVERASTKAPTPLEKPKASKKHKSKDNGR